jgi:broad specificity phosphatase PhoE
MVAPSTLASVPAERIHLVRHGEVNNPERILYGRLDGFGLTDRGHQMAEAVADNFSDHPIRRVISSPLLRARQTAEPLAAFHGLASESDERVIEGTNVFEGTRVNARRIITHPGLWRHLVNPLRPTWGEAYRAIAARMLIAMDEAWQSVSDGEIVIVSHQLPIWMVHRSVAHRPLPHSPSARRCTLASVTTFDRFDGRWREVGYEEPAKALLEGAIDLGAV